MAYAGAGMTWTHNRSAYMAVGGASVAPFALACFNRSGSGTVCTTDGDVTACTEQWSPWPFLVVAVVFMGVGVALTTRSRNRRESMQ